MRNRSWKTHKRPGRQTAAMRRARAGGSESQSPRGSVLILVLVVVAVLTLGAYTFSESMVAEVESSSMHGRQAQSRSFAESGLEHIAAVLGSPESSEDENYYHNPGRYQAIPIREAENARGRGVFSIVAPIESDSSSTAVRFGLIDESGKINVNKLVGMDLPDEVTREFLMYLPGMTEDIADSILDWVDDNTDIRPFGAESDYYEGLDPPVSIADAPIESLDELLNVAGVSPTLLYGEDANRNGLLDLNEDDGDAWAPNDNADGILDAGWSAYLTVHSREMNLRVDGEPRLNINDGILTDLYDKLVEEYGESEAQFIIAFRLVGPITDEEEESEPADPASDSDGTTVAGTDGSSGGDSRNSSSGGDGPNSGGTPLEDLAKGIGQVIGAVSGGDVTRAGMDLSGGATYEMKSLYELIGAQVEIEIDGTPTILNSPWSEGDMAASMPDLLDRLTIWGESEIIGRINANSARVEALLGIPNMDPDIAEAIAGSTVIGSDGTPLTNEILRRKDTSWLVVDGIVDLETMIELDRYLTGSGRVFKAQSVGYFAEGGGFTRLEAVIDGTDAPARILSVTDLTDLQIGYSKDQLNGVVGN